MHPIVAIKRVLCRLIDRSEMKVNIDTKMVQNMCVNAVHGKETGRTSVPELLLFDEEGRL
jgi:hypothetical protein